MSGDLAEGAKRATMIAARVSGFGGIEMGSAVDTSAGPAVRVKQGLFEVYGYLQRPG